MGQVIKFPIEPIEMKAHDKAPALKKQMPISAELLFFTGVRYERRMSLPSERLIPLAEQANQ